MNMQRFHHHIQADIFAKLRHNASLRYKDLKEPGLEPSQFTYHLKELAKQKLVEKTEKGGYRLAPAGVELAQHFSSSKGNLNQAPLSYTLIFLRTTDKRWFVVKRGKHPHIGKYACISGKIHMDETLQQAAERELYNQSMGLIKTTLEYRGYVSVMVREQGYITHITGPVWFADNLEPVALPAKAYGEILWADWTKLPYGQFIPGWKEIVEMIENDNPAYLDLSYLSP